MKLLILIGLTISSVAAQATCTSQLLALQIPAREVNYACANSHNQNELVQNVQRLAAWKVPPKSALYQIFELQERNHLKRAKTNVTAHMDCVDKTTRWNLPAQSAAYSCFQCQTTNNLASYFAECLIAARPVNAAAGSNAGVDCFRRLGCQP